MKELDFSAVASEESLRQSLRHSAVEPKVCELCRDGFYRPVPQSAKHGVKYCGACLKKFMERSSRVRENTIQ
jgi:hypothetical protein